MVPSSEAPPAGETEGHEMSTNRLTGYEAGWLTFLVNSGLASQSQARAAMDRVAQEAIDSINARAAKRARKRRRKE